MLRPLTRLYGLALPSFEFLLAAQHSGPLTCLFLLAVSPMLISQIQRTQLPLHTREPSAHLVPPDLLVHSTLPTQQQPVLLSRCTHMGILRIAAANQVFCRRPKNSEVDSNWPCLCCVTCLPLTPHLPASSDWLDLARLVVAWAALPAVRLATAMRLAVQLVLAPAATNSLQSHLDLRSRPCFRAETMPPVASNALAEIQFDLRPARHCTILPLPYYPSSRCQ